MNKYTKDNNIQYINNINLFIENKNTKLNINYYDKFNLTDPKNNEEINENIITLNKQLNVVDRKYKKYHNNLRK